MPRPSDESPEQAELLRRFQDEIAGMSPGDLGSVLQQLMSARPGAGLDPFERPAPPSRRRERRADVVTYRVRVDVTGTKPPLWRRLELASDMLLDELHDVLQAAFGWTDSHLHQFGSGTEYYGRDTEYYLCPFEVEEGETGIPEGEVRIDEVLAGPGDTLFYLYDFGDGWQHTVRLETVLPREGPGPRAVCTAGRRPGPPENIGGVAGYELHSAATDPARPAGARAEFAEMFGPEVDPARIGSTPFDIAAINAELAALGPAAPPAVDLPGPLADLVHAVRNRREAVRLQQLIGQAMPDEPAALDADTAARMVRPYTWLLDRVGDRGITLTSAGYLPPAHVEAAATELGLDDEWIGKHNRENQTLPVLELRESARKAGLLRKYRGKLLLTARAQKLRADPVGLWWHLAEQLPPTSRDACENQAGLLLMIGVAAGSSEDLDGTVARTLRDVGWMRGDGTLLTSRDAHLAAGPTRTMLRRLGALTGSRFREQERTTPEGITLARAALAHWPAGC
ncbi:plasmid pRiA4b ORF-3 family protein [Pseudonocardia parietis]|uniref:Plasmid pRiA4b Orf3-like domain-containing protein n=1 Tax=Pseudonocardia parietis TaxID=570936 RepID=A0ABS4VYT1_9PSEU|nr:plasmid pRiA4b ORF-3 family protein [Pseudonocardia parietis]MBP2369081.1 hypothetical protein [Pseudonocardia parietis]